MNGLKPIKSSDISYVYAKNRSYASVDAYPLSERAQQILSVRCVKMNDSDDFYPLFFSTLENICSTHNLTYKEVPWD
jgi:hypothetical protein